MQTKIYFVLFLRVGFLWVSEELSRQLTRLIILFISCDALNLNEGEALVQ